MPASALRSPAVGQDWFDGAGLGLFIHWSHCSVDGRELSWPMVGGNPALPRCQDLTVADYYSTVPRFTPGPDALREVVALGARAGARYAVLTARHHDGFALWPSQHGDFSIAGPDPGTDIVSDFVTACRDEGLRVGLYYSLSDWHHPDYPAWRDEDRPYPFIAYPRPEPDAWERYQEYLRGQLTDLLTRYGPIDVLWFDGQWERTPDLWEAGELRKLVRDLQPDCLVNDRLPGEGDFETPEQFVPPTPPDGRWEACMTMNASWGWNTDDPDYKSARELVHTLCETAGRGGNLLLNVGPRGDGSLPPEQQERLGALAAWMGAHAPAIHDTGAGVEPWQFYGPTTRRGQTLYLHLVMRPYDTVTVRGVPIARVARVTELRSGRELTFRTRCAILDQLLNSDPLGELTIDVPDDVVDADATVVAVEFEPEAA